MTDLSATAVRLLRAVVAEGQADWPVLQRSIGTSREAMTQALVELRGLVEMADPVEPWPPLRATEAGRLRLRQIEGREPLAVVAITLDSVPDRDTDALRVAIVSDGDVVLAMDVPVTSYRLSAIREVLVDAPGSVTADMLSGAAHRIGAALLPRCAKCRLSTQDCAQCVWGHVMSRVRVAKQAGGWIRLELRVAPPWTRVPWEMATVGFGDWLVQQPELSVVRRVGSSACTPTVDGEVGILVAVAASDSQAEDQRLAADAAKIVSGTAGMANSSRSLRAVVSTGFTDAADLADRIATARPMVVHVLGHGNAEGLSHLSRADAATAIAQAGVSAVVLAPCFGASAFGTDQAGASLAWQIANLGVSAVVGFDGLAEAAHAAKFAAAFYAELAETGSVEGAVRAGRTGMASAYNQFGQVVLFAA